MSKRAAVASRSRAALVALALLVPSLLLRSQPNESGFAESLKANVVAIRAAKTGFGFVVGERNGLLYIVTARHVVAPDTPDAAPPTPKLRFYADQGNTYDGRLLGTNDAAHDLAVISVQKPSVVQWNRQALAPSGLTTRGTRVWFVGRSDTWFVPVQPGTIVNEAPFRDHRIEADGLPVRVGTSGAPLVSASGIVGMIVTDGADDTRALSIEFIRTAFRDWAHPWNVLCRAA